MNKRTLRSRKKAKESRGHGKRDGLAEGQVVRLSRRHVAVKVARGSRAHEDGFAAGAVYMGTDVGDGMSYRLVVWPD